MAELNSRTRSVTNNEAGRCTTFAREAGSARGLAAADASSRRNCGWDRELFPQHFCLDRGSAGCRSTVTPETVSKLCSNGQVTEAVEALGILVHDDRKVSTDSCYMVLKVCVTEKDLPLGRRVHALIVRKGYESDTFLCNHILRMYASHARLQEAVDLFRLVPKPDAITWSAIISAHVKQGQAEQAVQLYRRMRSSTVKPNGHVFVAALQACGRGADLKSGQEVHADVLTSGVEPDLFVYSCLVDMYAKCGSLEDARRVFDGIPYKDVVTWNAIIAGYSQKGIGEESLRLYGSMLQEGMTAPNSVTFVSLLQACAGLGTLALETGKHLHAEIRKRGHQTDIVVAGSLVNMYAKCGSLEDAKVVFDGIVKKNILTWNAMIGGYALQGMGEEAFDLYRAMQKEGLVAPNSVTFVCLLQACASVGNAALEMGKQLHVQIEEQGLEADEFVASSLVDMYAKCGSLENARDVFNELSQKNVVTWSAMIAGYSQQGMGQEALSLYRAMQEVGTAAPNSVTFVSLLKACASAGTSALENGKQLHAQIRQQGLETDLFVANSLVNMLAKCGSIEDAQDVFNRLPRKDVVTWNAMIAGYSQQGMGLKALRLFTAMQQEGLAAPNSTTFVSLLQACAGVGTAALEEGKRLHAQIREQGLQANVFVGSSLVNMYAKCGSLEDAERAFDMLPQKDLVTWSAVIAGYSQQGMGQDALRLYKVMQEQDLVAPNTGIFTCLLHACSSVAALHIGRQIHAQIKEQRLQADALVARSLIIMYGNCGSMEDAKQVFDALRERDIVLWNALIAGYIRQGDSEKAFDSVLRMREDGIHPDDVTFLSVLTVCSHTGLVNKGREYFESMSRQYGITPTVDHYTCLVGLLGRAGHLDKALSLVTSMPVLPNAAIWHTLLGACQKWSNVEIGRYAFHEAVKLDKKDAAAYVLMSNIYLGAEMWEQAREMQARRSRTRAWKQPGQSWWADMQGQVHSFVVG